MNLDEKQTTDSALVTVAGEIDLYNSPELKRRLRDLLERGVKKIVLRLSDVSYIDSSGLGVLVNFASKLSAQSGALTLSQPSAQVRKVIEMTKLGSFFREA